MDIVKNVISQGESLRTVKKFRNIYAKSKYLIRQGRVFLKAKNLQAWFLCKMGKTYLGEIDKPKPIMNVVFEAKFAFISLGW